VVLKVGLLERVKQFGFLFLECLETLDFRLDLAMVEIELDAKRILAL
jgi:hypothetical protein